MKFKNSFGVKGTQRLLEAAKEYVEQLGWHCQTWTGNSRECMFFAGNHDNGGSLEPNHFWKCDSVDTHDGDTVYNLPEQWNEFITAATATIQFEKGQIVKSGSLTILVTDKPKSGEFSGVVISTTNNYNFPVGMYDTMWLESAYDLCDASLSITPNTPNTPTNE